MRKINRLLYLSLSLGGLTAAAQQTAVYTNELSDFNHAVALYNEEQYLAAQILFNKVKSSSVHANSEVEADCAYYIANCAIRLDQPRAEDVIDEFVKNYPTSSKQNQAYVEVTKYYFDKGDYSKALRYSEKVREHAISNEKVLNRFYFQKGYAYFANKNKNGAQKYLEKVERSSNYGEQAIYYLGYIAYDSNRFDEAKKLFGEVVSKEKYQQKMGYFQSDMSFKSGNFEKAIEQGVAQMQKSTPEEKSELSKIVGESYFNLKEYDKALPYLLDYKGKNEKWSNTDFYQLGYAHYKLKQYDKAIEQFNKIIGGKDAIAQNAYYHLGESYLNSSKKTEALNAFKNASEMSYDLKIQEDAYLNYGKLSYEIGNPYQSTPSVLAGFLAKYPATPYKTEMESLLIDSYITSRNFKEALDLLEKDKEIKHKEAYQKVTFYRGIELFGEGKFQDALALLNKSIAEKQNLTFTSRAHYWKGETQYALNKFSDAVTSYSTFLKDSASKETAEYKNVDYNIAYAYFKQKDYVNAVTYFQRYSNTKGDSARLQDAYVRLGDCNFVLGKYWPAMEAYNKVIDSKGPEMEYASFQKALSYGFVDRLDKKIEDLTQFVKKHPKSNLVDDAQYELGVSYVAAGQTTKAIQAFDQLMKDYPNSAFKSRAILRQGLIYYNSNQNEQALSKFKAVAAAHPNTPEAVEAVANARLIYMDSGRVEEYGEWVKGLDFVEVTNVDLDNDTFESAEKQYVQNNVAAAKTGLSNYIDNFPNGLHAVKANFYLAQLYMSSNETAKAVPYFDFVISKPKSEFTEQALTRLGEVYLTQKSYDKAIAVLERLELEANQEQNVVFAQSNLMKVFYEQGDKNKALFYAEKVLKSSRIDNRVKSDAQLIVARIAIQNNDDAKAKAAYLELAKVAKGEVAAEAMYYDAYFKNKAGQYEASNTAVQKLAKDYSSYKLYGAKGLILMAKNFYKLKDSYQATYILESVTQNFGDYPEVVSEAKKELDKIKQEESKRNSSISN